MKNKKLTIFLIVILSIISIALIVFMIGLINGNFKFLNFKFNYKVSNELVLDEVYDNEFNDISILSNASDIYIKQSSDEYIRVIIYGEKENTSVENQNEKLSIVSKQKSCTGFCFNNTIAKVEVYIPKEYENSIEINNQYGDIRIDEFSNANIDIDEDCGDVTVISGKKVSIDNNFGDITLDKADSADIKESAGNVKIGDVFDITVNNAYGDIEINRVNNYLNLSNDCGDIKVRSIVLNKNSYIENNFGDIKIESTNEIYINAQTNLGDVKINNNYQKSDITLTIKNDLGDITINN